MNRKYGRVLFAAVFFIFSFSSCAASDDIDSVLKRASRAGKVVMLELGSVGCIPCERMKPIMEKLRTDYKNKLEVIFVDVRRDTKTARRFGVMVIPTQVFLDEKGKEFFRHIGFFSYEEIVPVLKRTGL